MKVVVTIAVLLAVVAVALVTVCQHSETRRMQHEVWRLERHRERLERSRRQLQGAVEAGRTPRRLLEAHDRDGGFETEGGDVR